MTVQELIEKLNVLDKDKTVFISCEGGCVVDSDISILQEGDKVFLEI